MKNFDRVFVCNTCTVKDLSQSRQWLNGLAKKQTDCTRCDDSVGEIIKLLTLAILDSNKKKRKKKEERDKGWIVALCI